MTWRANESSAPAAVTQAEPVKRYSSLETECWVPTVQAGIIALSYSITLGLLVTGIIAAKKGSLLLAVPLAIAFVGILIFSVAVTVLFIDQRKLHRKPGQAEKAKHKAEKQDPFVIENIERSASGSVKRITQFDFGITKDELVKLAKGLTNGKPLTETNWTGRGNPFSKTELGQIRSKLIEHGWARWVNEKAHAQGCELTKTGEAALRYIVQCAATPPPPPPSEGE